MPQYPPWAAPYGENPETAHAQQAQQAAMAPGPWREADLRMPNARDMGGSTPPPWVRYPYYPTAPFYSTDPTVGYQTRFYSAELISTDTDYTQGVEALRRVQFDLPVRLIAFTGAAVDVNGAALPVGLASLDTFLFRAEYTQGDRLHTAARLGSSVVGTGGFPAEIGGTGWTMDGGATLILGITPLRASMRIDITCVCLEMRGPSNYVSPGARR